MTGTIGARKATMSFACGGSLGLSSFAYPLSLDPFLCSSQRACKCLVKTLCILFVKINWTKIHLPLHRIARKWCHAFFHAHILLFWPIWGPVIYFYNYCSDHEEASVEGWHHDNTFECLFEAGPQASNINSWLLSYKKTLFISGNLLFSWPFLFQTTLQWILISRGSYNWLSTVGLSAVISTVALAKGIISILITCFCPRNDKTKSFREIFL